MKIIDTHVHIYPDAIADKAAQSVSGFYGLPLYNSGKVSNLVDTMKKNGVSKAVVCSVATSAKQVCKINDFMATQLDNKYLHPLATLHPDMEKAEIADEAARIKALGLKGIKLHPDFQKFKLSGEDGIKLFDAIGDFDLPMLVHMGDRRFNFSHPEYMIEVARDFPNLKFVAAHFGGWTEWEQAMNYKGLKNVFFDTSSSLGHLDNVVAKTVLLGLGVEKFMFGTDFPLWHYDEEIERVRALELGDRNNELVFHENAERIYNITD